MIIYKTYKVELVPNNKQKTYLEKSFGCARFAYNWGLNQRIELYRDSKKRISFIEQQNNLSRLKKSQFSWMYEISKCAPQNALRDLDKAFKNFFRGIKQKKKMGFPKFKSKHSSKQSFYIQSPNFKITEIHIKLPKISVIRFKEKNYIPLTNIKYNSVIISKEAGKYFASVQCELNIPEPQKPKEILGIDLGIKTLATCSNGTIFENPKALYKREKQLKKAQRCVSRKKKGSNNRKKAILKVQKIHYKIKNIRKDVIHKTTTFLVKAKPRAIVLENLAVSNMLKNHNLAKSIADASFYEIRRQLEYKTQWYGGEILYVDRFFPSSKMCSFCNNVKHDLKLSDRMYHCSNCNNIIDRDLNAVINLKNYYNTVSSMEINACGENVRPNAMVQEAVSIKQEKSLNLNVL